MSGQALLTAATAALALVGLAATTLGVVGLYRMPDAYTQIHAAAKVLVLGVVALLLATFATGELAVAGRATLVAVFLIATMPVGTHAIARAAYRQGERVRGRGDAADGDGG